jgi:hypothetical protein
MQMIRGALLRFFQAWERHPGLFSVPAGAAVAWTWIRFHLPGIVLSALFGVPCLVVAVRAHARDDGENW